MDAAAGPALLESEAPLRSLPPRHRSAGRTPMFRWQAKVALFGLVFVLGLLQGTRTALGLAPLASPAARADVSAPPARELDPIRGHFFRPPGSDAVRPPLSLRPAVWWPERPLPVAQACPAGPNGSC
jgi:hypothetical protein